MHLNAVVVVVVSGRRDYQKWVDAKMGTAYNIHSKKSLLHRCLERC